MRKRAGTNIPAGIPGDCRLLPTQLMTIEAGNGDDDEGAAVWCFSPGPEKNIDSKVCKGVSEMIDFDKEIMFSCPAECGQLSVPCSLRKILDKEIFFCDCCGCEFQGSDFPDWLSHAVCIAGDKDRQALRDMMIAVYSYLYANGKCPDENQITAIKSLSLTSIPCLLIIGLLCRKQTELGLGNICGGK